jgi:hypothetical protein
MADGHGGYRRPTHPAPVSGPGALSRRTDGGPQAIRELPNAKYGEGATYRAAEQAAPMSGGMSMPSAPPPNLSPDLSGLTPMGAPSERPDEPITAGMPMGAGAGSTGPSLVAGMSPEQAERLRSYLPVLVLLASQDDVDPSTKSFVRRLRGELG